MTKISGSLKARSDLPDAWPFSRPTRRRVVVRLPCRELLPAADLVNHGPTVSERFEPTLTQASSSCITQCALLACKLCLVQVTLATRRRRRRRPGTNGSTPIQNLVLHYPLGLHSLLIAVWVKYKSSRLHSKSPPVPNIRRN